MEFMVTASVITSPRRLRCSLTTTWAFEDFSEGDEETLRPFLAAFVLTKFGG